MKALSQNLLDLTIVIPAYQEEKRIGVCLDKLSKFLRSDKLFKHKKVEVIVVCADTTDKTKTIVLDKKSKFTKLILLETGQHIGKGRDVKFGMLRAQGKYVLFMDADLATPLEHLTEFYQACLDNNDVVIGRRSMRAYHSNPTRRFISFIGNILFRLAGGLWLEDSQCGFKIFNARACKLCFSKLKITDWGFDMEVLVIAKSNGLTIKSLNINDWEDQPYTTFTDNILKVIAWSMKDLGLIVARRISGKYT